LLHPAAQEGEFMQAQAKVVVDDRALLGWHLTPAADRAKVLLALEGLVGQAPEDYPPAAVERWWPDKRKGDASIFQTTGV
jgi:hypothetical protein